jgi:hypothetical protein
VIVLEHICQNKRQEEKIDIFSVICTRNGWLKKSLLLLAAFCFSFWNHRYTIFHCNHMQSESMNYFCLQLIISLRSFELFAAFRCTHINLPKEHLMTWMKFAITFLNCCSKEQHFHEIHNLGDVAQRKSLRQQVNVPVTATAYFFSLYSQLLSYIACLLKQLHGSRLLS